MTIAANLLNAASDAYDDSALGFRDYFGRKTVEKLNIREGARVLDVCCSAGTVALRPTTESRDWRPTLFTPLRPKNRTEPV
jgi:ubiquinone/menaquinone biosynthesis C-methylase UbiE